MEFAAFGPLLYRVWIGPGAEGCLLTWILYPKLYKIVLIFVNIGMCGCVLT